MSIYSEIKERDKNDLHLTIESTDRKWLLKVLEKAELLLYIAETEMGNPDNGEGYSPSWCKEANALLNKIKYD